MERAGRNKSGYKEAQRGQDNDQQCDPEVFGKHEDQSADDCYNTGKELCKSEQETV